MTSTDAPERSLPLDGVRVLDLGQYISGPCAAVLLAEMGADVVKVEPPGGDAFRQWEAEGLNATFVAFNRGKRSIVLDLKADDDRRTLMRLAASADVLVENFRPGVTERLGVDPGVIMEANPRLIYCSITGFGSSGPYSKMPAYDGVGLGYSGLAGLLIDPDDPQLRGPAMADAITGHSAAMSVLAALVRRSRTQEGERIEVSMLGALVHFLHSAVSKRVVEGREEGPYSRIHASQAFVFKGTDGLGLIIHLSSPTKFWQGLCRAVEREDLLEDSRFVDLSARRRNYDELVTELRPAFSQRTRNEWLEVLQANQVPCAPVNTMAEALSDEQVRHLGIIDVIHESGVGLMPRIRPPAHFDGTPLPPVSRAPYLGEHTKSLLSELATGAEG